MTDLATQITGPSGAVTPARPRPPAGSALPPAPSIGKLMRGPLIFGLLIAGAFFGGLGLWAGTAPLVSGAIAPGVVSPDGNRKAIQHLEGGIIQSVLVRENQRVAEGELLMTLDPLQAEADLGSQQGEWDRLAVTRARLKAEASGASTWEIPPEVATRDDPDFLAFIDSQRLAFETRTAGQQKQRQSMENQIEQLQREIEGLQAQSTGLSTQLALLREDLPNKQRLLEQQLVSRSVVLDLEMSVAQTESSIGANLARIAQANLRIDEIGSEIDQARQRYLEEVAQLTSQNNDAIARLSGGMVSSGDRLQRKEIRSPVEGIVLNLQLQTPGGVIRPGETIMEVVPLDEDLIVIARLAPKDIDLVETGLRAQVSLVPFATRNMLPLSGEVTQVAADSKVDEATGAHFYEVRVSIPPEEIAKHDGVYLSPGMPADVTVVTGERTMLHYLFDPFVKSLGSAFVYD